MRVAPAGRARIRMRRPSAIGECDICASWWNLDDLKPKVEWTGNRLRDTRLLVCRDCADKPQNQYRAPILPPDPYPRINPRLSPNVTGIPYVGGPLPTPPDQQGFTSLILGEPVGGYPQTKAGVLAAAQTATGVTAPATVATYNAIMTGAVKPLVGLNTARTYLLIYNPAAQQVQLSKGTATSGAITNLMIGPGQAYFWATAQNLAPIYTGAMTALGPSYRLPLWVWEDGTGLISNGGVLTLAAGVTGYPTSSTGLAAGALWSNSGVVSIVSGATPSPLAAPVYFGAITAAGLLTLGGANLPTSDPHNPNQIYNNGGEAAISIS